MFIRVILFGGRYIREFGFIIPGRQILVDDIRVRGIGHSKTSVAHEVPAATTPPPVKKVFLPRSCVIMQLTVLPSTTHF